MLFGDLQGRSRIQLLVFLHACWASQACGGMRGRVVELSASFQEQNVTLQQSALQKDAEPEESQPHAAHLDGLR